MRLPRSCMRPPVAPTRHMERDGARTRRGVRTEASGFARDATHLTIATIAAQGLTLAATPLLTRIFEPTEFATLAVYLAAVSTLHPVATGRFELALVVTSEDRDADDLLVALAWLSVSVSVLLVAIGATLLVLGGATFGAAAQPWMWLVAPGLLLGAWLAGLRSVANRNAMYDTMGSMKVAQAFATVAGSLAAAWIGTRGTGLIVGAMAGVAAAGLFACFRLRRMLCVRDWRWSARTRAILRRYREYPLLLTPTGVLDAGSIALPVFFLSQFHSDSVVGQYALIMRVIAGPLGLVSQPIGQVFLRRAAQAAEGRRDLLARTVLTLLAIVALPATIVIATGPRLFSFAFGPEWTLAGSYAAILMPAIALRFVASTVSGGMLATGHRRHLAVWQTGAFAATLATCLVFAPADDPTIFVVALAAIDIILYALYLALTFFAFHSNRGLN
jgi:O-antigen/teichoic acid export membrane protein